MIYISISTGEVRLKKKERYICTYVHYVTESHYNMHAIYDMMYFLIQSTDGVTSTRTKWKERCKSIAT